MLKALTLALSLLLCGAALSQETPEQKPDAAKAENSAVSQKPATVPPIIVNVVPTPKTEADKEEERHERQEKAELDKKLVELTAELSAYTGGLYAATVVLAIATVFLVIGTFGLVVFAFKQARDTKTSIDIANASLELSKIEMGADMVMSKAHVANTAMNPIANVSFTNSGKTRAIDLILQATIGTRFSPGSDEDFPPPEAAVLSRADVGPQRIANNRTTFDAPLSDAQRSALADGTITLYVWGTISHGTVFGGLRIQQTFRFAMGGPYGPYGDGNMAVCEEGNSKK